VNPARDNDVASSRVANNIFVILGVNDGRVQNDSFHWGISGAINEAEKSDNNKTQASTNKGAKRTNKRVVFLPTQILSSQIFETVIGLRTSSDFIESKNKSFTQFKTQILSIGFHVQENISLRKGEKQRKRTSIKTIKNKNS
jgi:hypothetical protein